MSKWIERKRKINPDYTWFDLKIIRSQIHHRGVFAAQDIPARRYVMEYTGEIRNRAQAKKYHARAPERDLIYIWEIPSKRYHISYWELDGFIGGSGAELVNHSCDPNLYPIFCGKRLYYVSSRKIKKGEELTISYGEGYFTSRSLECVCNSELCFEDKER